MSLKKILSVLTNKTKIKGENNIISFGKNAYRRKVKIAIYGDNNRIEVADDTYLHNMNIRLGFPDCRVNNCLVKIGKGTSFNSADIQLAENSSCVEIGENCMFSFNVEISCTDTHSILDADKNLINIGKSVKVGSNVWVCKNVVILKNTQIPDNCIVAQGSIVTKKYDTPNCVIAGNPARVVKNDIIWTRERPQKYLDKQK